MADSPWSRETWLAVILVIAAVILIPTVLLLGSSGGGMMGGGSVTGWAWIPMMGLLAVIGVGLFLYLVLVPGIAQPVIPPPYPHPEWGYPPPGATSLQILDARYARGEISREDYLRMRQDLEPRKE